MVRNEVLQRHPCDAWYHCLTQAEENVLQKCSEDSGKKFTGKAHFKLRLL